jgi:hypothetical protein
MQSAHTSTSRFRTPVNPDILSDEVKKLVDEGQIIPAVQAHRRLTGTGLAEAKRAVDLCRGKVAPEERA